MGIILSNEMITFLVLWEIMSLSSYFLVVHEPAKKDVMTQGARYFIITHIGFFALLFAFLPFSLQSWSTYFDLRTAAPFTMWTKNIIFLLALLGFGSKAWIVPFHIRLPKAHPIAPSHISAMMSGCMVKIPVLFLFIFIQQFFINQLPLWRGLVVLILGAISALVGVFYALIQHNIKRLLAHHTIENIGIIFIWLGLYMIGTTLGQPALSLIGIFASLYHSFNHAVFKSLLFLTAGSIIERTGESDIERLGWLIKKIPWVAISFFIWSRAIIWLPPLNGFNSEILTMLWIIQGFQLTQNIWITVVFIIALVMVWMMSAAAIACFTKACSVIFLGNQRDRSYTVDVAFSRAEVSSFVWMIVAIIWLSVLPGSMLRVVHTILGTTPTPSLSAFSLPLTGTTYIPRIVLVVFVLLVAWGRIRYRSIIKRSLTKTPRNCWYPVIVPQTQYSWSSFVQPLRRVFMWFFWETKTMTPVMTEAQQEGRKYFKKELSSFHYTVTHRYRFDLFFDVVIQKIAWLSKLTKSIMNGNLNFYIAYMFVTLIVSSLLWYRIK